MDPTYIVIVLLPVEAPAMVSAIHQSLNQRFRTVEFMQSLVVCNTSEFRTVV